MANVILQATDAEGNKVGDLFYNSLGGIPDFSSRAGTSTNGGRPLQVFPPPSLSPGFNLLRWPTFPNKK